MDGRTGFVVFFISRRAVVADRIPKETDKEVRGSCSLVLEDSRIFPIYCELPGFLMFFYHNIIVVPSLIFLSYPSLVTIPSCLGSYLGT